MIQNGAEGADVAMEEPTVATGQPTDAHIAVFFSGQRRTFDLVRASLSQLLCTLSAQATVHLFDCSDAGDLEIPFFTFSRVPPPTAWTWPSSAVEVLRQFERASHCWHHVREYESSHSIEFEWVIKTRPDVAVGLPIDLRAMSLEAWRAALSSRPRTLLVRVRCWPGVVLPRHSYALPVVAWRVGHARCGHEPLADDAFLVLPRRLADDLFGRIDVAPGPSNVPSTYPRCNVTFKAYVAAECVFTRHLRVRNIQFMPHPFDLSIAREGYRPTTHFLAAGAACGQPHERGVHSQRANHRVEVCATEDPKGVCRVALPFVRSLITEALRAWERGGQCTVNSTMPVHVLVGCDNAPARGFAQGLTPYCRARFAEHARAFSRGRPSFTRSRAAVGASTTLVHQLCVMVLKEPAAVAQHIFAPLNVSVHRALLDEWRLHKDTLVIDSFRGIGAPNSPSHARMHAKVIDGGVMRVTRLASGRNPVLFAPWATVSYASRMRPPAALSSSLTRDEATIEEAQAKPTGPSPTSRAAPLPPRFCAVMGHVGAVNWWHAPGYIYRDQLRRALNCTHLRPNDRRASTLASDGRPTQYGPFEGTHRHYSGHRFVMAVENTHHGSPVSEKIVNAYLAGAVPIVWGGGLHRHLFDSRSFVDCTRRSVDACASKVRVLEADPTRLRAMLAAPRFESRLAFDNFFAWTAEARGSAQQRRLHDGLLDAIGSSVGCQAKGGQ